MHASSSRDVVVAAPVVTAVRSDPGATFPRVGRAVNFARCRRREGPSAFVSFADVGEGRGPKAVRGQASQRPGWTRRRSHSPRQARLGTPGCGGQRFPSAPRRGIIRRNSLTPIPRPAQRNEASQGTSCNSRPGALSPHGSELWASHQLQDCQWSLPL